MKPLDPSEFKFSDDTEKADPKYQHTAVNKNGDRVGWNEATRKWEPIPSK
jgi:hypothetical protein